MRIAIIGAAETSGHGKLRWIPASLLAGGKRPRSYPGEGLPDAPQLAAGCLTRDEALARGHQVTAIVRHPGRIAVRHPFFVVVKRDVLQDKVDDLVRGHDADISAYSPGWTNQNMYSEQVKGARAIIDGVRKSGVKRLLMAGGAGSLEVAPGVQLIDQMDISERVKGGVLATRETLYMLREEEELEWTFLSPPLRIAPGERTGRYRAGKDQLLKYDQGDSKISTQDCAAAMLDELEQPQHVRQSPGRPAPAGP